MNEIKLIKIFTAQDSLQAEMISEALKNASIPSLKQDLDAGCFMKLYGGNSKWREDIYVKEQDAPKALEVLQGMGLL